MAESRRGLPLRIRLTLYYTIFFALALLLLSVGTYLAVWWSLNQSVSDDMHALQQQVAAAMQPATSPADVRDGMQALTNQQAAGVYTGNDMLIQVFTPDWQYLGSSNSASDAANTPPMPLPAAALELEPGAELLVDVMVDNADMRMLVAPVAGSDGQPVAYLHITRTIEDVQRTLWLLLLVLVGGGLLALLLTGVGTALLAGTALAPIKQVTTTAQGIVHAEDLSQRVPVPPTDDETYELAVTFNNLLARLEELFKMQQRLIADVSHELRTPLTAMQGNLDVLHKAGTRDPALLHESLTDLRSETARLIRMVNDLLLLSKSELNVPLRRELVELDMLLLEVYRELRPITGGVALHVDLQDQVLVDGDRDRIKQALLNLGINAIQHTPAGGNVTLQLGHADGMAHLRVIDTGSGIAPADIQRIFDRFYRADSSRTRRDKLGGSGLGLAIVQHVAAAHGGRVTVESDEGHGSTFTLCLPLLPTGDDDPAAPVPDVVADEVATV